PPALQSAALRPRATARVCGPPAQNPEGRPPRQRPAWHRCDPWHYFIYCNDEVSIGRFAQISRKPILTGSTAHPPLGLSGDCPMSDIHSYSNDVAFTPAVKAIQTRKGSRKAHARVEQNGGWRTEIDEHLTAYLAETYSLYFATASADGQPYIQHRGGPKGFIKVLDKNTLAFADYSGNRQYITQGNLSENPKANIFVMDYAHRRRVKIWGEARVVDDDAALMKSLMPQGYRARPEQVILFKISVWDTNCPQHIPQKFDAADVAAALATRDARIAELEAELAALKGESVPAHS